MALYTMTQCHFPIRLPCPMIYREKSYFHIRFPWFIHFPIRFRWSIGKSPYFSIRFSWFVHFFIRFLWFLREFPWLSHLFLVQKTSVLPVSPRSPPWHEWSAPNGPWRHRPSWCPWHASRSGVGTPAEPGKRTCCILYLILILISVLLSLFFFLLLSLLLVFITINVYY